MKTVEQRLNDLVNDLTCIAKELKENQYVKLDKKLDITCYEKASKNSDYKVSSTFILLLDNFNKLEFLRILKEYDYITIEKT